MEMNKKSWKTTIIGIVLGLVPIVQQTINLLSANQHVDWYQVGLGVGLAILGWFAKDAGVTGIPK